MNDPRLYILMRTDLASLNSGKGMAQAAHAANAVMMAYMQSKRRLHQHVQEPVPSWHNPFQAWMAQTDQGFGTTLTLAVDNEDAMEKLVLTADAMGYLADMILDPSYPVRDGGVTHLLPINTCAYIFSPDGSPWFLSTLPLHP